MFSSASYFAPIYLAMARTLLDFSIEVVAPDLRKKLEACGANVNTCDVLSALVDNSTLNVCRCTNVRPCGVTFFGRNWPQPWTFPTGTWTFSWESLQSTNSELSSREPIQGSLASIPTRGKATRISCSSDPAWKRVADLRRGSFIKCNEGVAGQHLDNDARGFVIEVACNCQCIHSRSLICILKPHHHVYWVSFWVIWSFEYYTLKRTGK